MKRSDTHSHALTHTHTQKGLVLVIDRILSVLARRPLPPLPANGGGNAERGVQAHT